MIIVTHINPEPWAVGTTYVTRRKGGSLASGISPNRKMQDYQQALREELIDRLGKNQLGHVYSDDGTTKLFVRFWFWRQLEAATTPTSKGKIISHVADTTNMQKSTEDAIQGILTGNDKNNLITMSEIVEQGSDTVATVAILLAPIAERANIQCYPTPLVIAERRELLKKFQQESEASYKDRNAW